MEKSLDAYNAQYPLAYYEVGTAYSFYQQKKEETKPMAATAEQVNNFAAALASAKNTYEFVPASGEWQAFKRAIGIVINKYKLEQMGVLDVMFEDDGVYTVRKYGVEMPSVFFDDKEFVPTRKKSATGPDFGGKQTGPDFGGKQTGPDFSGSYTGPKF